MEPNPLGIMFKSYKLILVFQLKFSFEYNVFIVKNNNWLLVI